MVVSPTAFSRLFRLLRRHEANLLIAIVLVVGLTTIFDSEHSYWTDPETNIRQIVRQTSLLGIFSLGAAVVIIAGGIDLSAGSVICFSGTICATLLLVLAPEQMQSSETPIGLSTAALAIGGTLVIGFLIGSLHAWLITVVGLPPFIATLATLVGLRSFARAICENVTEAVLNGRSTQIQIFDPRFRSLATSVWIPAVAFLVLAAAAWFVLGRTVTGRHLYALGGNEEAARLSGIRTDRIKWFAYCLSALLSSVAGIFYICEQSVATPLVLGRGYELNAIAAAVVGGCSLQGGVGTIGGTLLGALFLRIVTDGIAKVIHTGADVYEGLIVGVVVVFAVAFSQTKQRRQRTPFFAGGLGLIAAFNLSLMAAAMAATLGPTLLEDWTQVEGPLLAAWAALSVFALLMLVRSRLEKTRLKIAAMALACGVVGFFAVLDLGIPAYRLNAAQSAVHAAGGTMTRDEDGRRIVDLAGLDLDDEGLRRIVERLRVIPEVAGLSLARTQVTDRGIASIKRLAKLKRLELSGTKVSRKAKTELGRSLPDVEIVD